MRFIYDEIEKQRAFVSQMAAGIDPTTGMKFIEDTVLNNRAIIEALKDVEKTLNAIANQLDKGNSVVINRGPYKKAFFFYSYELEKMNFSEEPITISELAFRINECLKKPYMKKLRATEITAWLEDEGYLISITDDGENYRKIPTQRGEEIGIVKVEKKNSIDKLYTANLYGIQAQHFLIANLDKICECK